MTQLLKFGRGNSKLSKDILTFSLPAGHSCPSAHACKAMAHPDTGNITDGKYQKFRCFAASAEARPNVRAARWWNFNLTLKAKSRGTIYDLIMESLKEHDNFSKVRIHVSGDFYSQAYFDAWLDVADSHPEITFYAYTKSLHFWSNRITEIPVNMHLVAMGLRCAKVVMTPEEAEVLGLEIDHDDSHAYGNTENSFALLIHGTQPAGSESAAAIKYLKDNNIQFAYSK